MRQPDFLHNQTFKLLCLYHDNKEQTYNEMQTDK